ncbi:asparagine synthase (glutamine-hydrolyzing) [Limisalsivibrio acetivorans]|uniref:asparagine synthase (glutamine-hydrolyzing) n=1 Tax=Limisalsivibrio acetivorans TaxID=1304888 RepID=UPI0003B5C870|nr:asparagine synthase (glutamine-hydrolyzing) [Limisalsivibrio acetivorans]
MCGIAGIFTPRGSKGSGIIKRMTDSIAHRGPDDAGYLVAGSEGLKHYLDPNLRDMRIDADLLPEETKPWNLAIGHRRLRIIDLSPNAHQPMNEGNGRYWIAYNGETYNYRELRNELEAMGESFFSTSDTEVVLKGYIRWGAEVLNKLNGMFAFVVYDSSEGSLFIARDRYGIKPLYYTDTGSTFLFASEIKALLEHPECKAEIDPAGLNEYFTFQNNLDGRSIFSGITLMEPGTYITINRDGVRKSTKYWDYSFSEPDDSMSFEEARDKTRELMEKAVQRQIVADVPVGSYLSGGMDSGSITALASRHIDRITTFTAGFELSRVTGVEATFDERRDAEVIANTFLTEHYEQVINAGDMPWVMPRLVRHLEDIRLGMSYPNYYISRLASKFVKVCLSGAGGDELFGGYPWRYYRVCNSVNKEEFFKNYYNFWQRLVPDNEKKDFFRPELYSRIDRTDCYPLFREVFGKNGNAEYITPEDHVANSLYFEVKTFLHGLLILGDKLSMANSLEERFPFLDNELVDFAMKIPVRYKLKDLANVHRIDENETRRNMKYMRKYNDGKNVLRAAMKSFLPEKIVNRNKQGFSAPDESWYRGENFEYVRETLLSSNAHIDRYIERGYINRIIEEHAGGENHRLLIWSFICFEEWCRQFGF